MRALGALRIVPRRLVGPHVAAVDRPSCVRGSHSEGAAPTPAARRVARPVARPPWRPRSTASSSSTCSCPRSTPIAAPRSCSPRSSGSSTRKRRTSSTSPSARSVREWPAPAPNSSNNGATPPPSPDRFPHRGSMKSHSGGYRLSLFEWDLPAGGIERRMPRLRQVPRAEATPSVVAMYDFLFGPDRDPVAEPGTASGTPGDWWTVFALVPEVFDHAVAGLVRVPRLGRASSTRSCASSASAAPVGRAAASSCSRSTARRCGLRASPRSRCRRSRSGRARRAGRRSSARCSPTPTVSCTTADVCPTRCSTRSEAELSDEQILYLTYITALYDMHG